ncbi:MAG: DUF3418 domain-containing protein [Bifidobacteriaceae bacterium]|nr:DUF3418 domain-containing protein [Bifidobacteriaceae bacterium]
MPCPHPQPDPPPATTASPGGVDGAGHAGADGAGHAGAGGRAPGEADGIGHNRVDGAGHAGAGGRAPGEADGIGHGGGGSRGDGELVWRRVWPAEAIHKALLTGLLSQVGMLPTTAVGARGPAPKPPRKPPRAIRGEYLGARGTKFALWPGSALRRRPPPWVMAAELVETSRLWGRTCAAINPDWVEQAAGHLVRRVYAEPRWSARQGAALITERVLVYGLPVVAGRAAPLSKVDAPLARELFIRHALVEGDWRTDHAFYLANRALVERAEELAARSRSATRPISDEALFDFYDERVPASVTSARHFDAWWKRAQRVTPDMLTLTPDLVADGFGGRRDDFPDEWTQGSFALPLTYRYEPGADQDGVTVHIPIQYANQIRLDGFDWQVPGLRQDLVAALIRSLPKPLRAELLPARETARQAVARLGPPSEWLAPDGSIMPLTSALSRVFHDMRGVLVPADAWNWGAVPRHLRVEFAIEDPKGRVMVAGLDLRAAVAAAAPDVSAAISRVAAASTAKAKHAGGTPSRGGGPGGGMPGGGRPGGGRPGGGMPGRGQPGGVAAVPDAAPQTAWAGSRTGLTTWDFGDLPPEVTAVGEERVGIVHGSGPLAVRGYPALIARPGGVDLRLATSGAEAAMANPVGVRELLLGELALPSGRLTSRFAPEEALALAATRYESVAALTRDAQAAVVDAAVAAAGLPRTRAAYLALRDTLRGSLEDATHEVLRKAAALAAQGRRIETEAAQIAELAVLDSVTDIKAHAARLVGPGFLTRAGLKRLADLRRYLAGDAYRLPRLGATRGREAAALALLADLRDAHDAALAASGPNPALAEIPWMLEELRISLLAQPLGAAYPVSEKRVRRALAAAAG